MSQCYLLLWQLYLPFMWYLSVFSKGIEIHSARGDTELEVDTPAQALLLHPLFLFCAPTLLVVVHSVVDSFGTRKQKDTKHCSCELKYVHPKSFRVTLGSFRRPCCGQPSSRSRSAAVEVCLSSISQRSRNREKPRRFIYVASNPGGPSWRSLW